MTHHLIASGMLIAMFVIATALPINIGVLAFVGAFIVGTLLAGDTTKEIIAEFPSGLFLTLAGITWLFALAQNNGTIDWLVRSAVRAVRGRLALIPWIMFSISAVLTAIGAVTPGAVAIVAPIALSFAFRYKISPLMMGMMVAMGASAGAFSPATEAAESVPSTADASRFVFARLATVATVIVRRMNDSENQIGISGAHSIGSPPLMKGTSFTCIACSTSFTAMKPRITARPCERYTRRSSRPEIRKYSWRRPSSANALRSTPRRLARECTARLALSCSPGWTVTSPRGETS